jgi:hypothetical protein
MKVLSKFVRSIDVAASKNGANRLISSALRMCRPGRYLRGDRGSGRHSSESNA